MYRSYRRITTGDTFILTHLAKRMRLPSEKVPIAISEYGNTSSASIPLAIGHPLRESLHSGE